MKYRRFGRTEIKMPVFSCGGMRFQQTWEDIPPDRIEDKNQENLNNVVRKAYELGISHFETARGYGTSEVQLGRILPTLPRDKIIVQTKVPPKDTIEEFEATLQKSFDLLKLEYIDLLAIHGMYNSETKFDKGLKCLPVLEKWQRNGRIGHIGVSGHGSLKLLKKIIKSDRFDYINIHFYFIKQDLYPALQMAEKHDMGVFIISPNDKGGKLYQPPEKLCKLTSPLTPMQFNDLFCLSHPQIHTLSIGAAEPENFDEHLEILDKLDSAKKITEPIVQKIEDAIAGEFCPEWLKTYQEGIKPWDQTPQNINIPVILWLYTLAKGLDMVEFGKMRYNVLESMDGDWFPGSKATAFETVDIEEAIKDSPYAEKIPAMLREAHKLMHEEEKE